MSIILELSRICKSFGSRLLLDNISFSLKKGEIATLIGQNGAGKTTIAKIILGLESYDAGDLIIDPKAKLGYVPQYLNIPDSLPLSASALLSVLLGSDNYDRALMEEYFPAFASLRDRDVKHLSGGERQKLLLISTILKNPDLIILDEPTQFLDLNAQQDFYQLLAKLRSDKGVTIFMISHDLFAVMLHSDQVICLNKHVCCTGKPTDIEHDLNFKNALSEIGFYIHNHDHKH